MLNSHAFLSSWLQLANLLYLFRPFFTLMSYYVRDELIGGSLLITLLVRRAMKILTTIISLPIILLLAACTFDENRPQDKQTTSRELPEITETALFAGGCFWCMEKPFEDLKGVISVTSGYAGGTTKMPTYRNYESGNHIEVVQIIYDPKKISYKKLLDTFWRQIDPTDDGGQFVDRGHAYTTGIFYYSNKQRELAEESKRNLQELGIFKEKVITPVAAAPEFWPAEEYHQDYYKKNPLRYGFYRSGSGRDSFLKKHWNGVSWPED